MSQLSEMVKNQSDKILHLERQLAEQTRRANVAEAWQRRLTSLLANRTTSTLTSTDRSPTENKGE